MKAVASIFLVFALVCSAAPPTYAEPRQVLQGTEIHLTLIDGINSATAREGDPFVAILAQPVALDSRIVLPAGTRVHGIIGTIQRPKQFAMFRGQAYMNLSFKSIEIDSRLIPVQMSLLAIGQPRVNSDSKRRRDVKIVEGEEVEQKHDYKGDAEGMVIGGGGGSLGWPGLQQRRPRHGDWFCGWRALRGCAQRQERGTSRADGHAGAAR